MVRPATIQMRLFLIQQVHTSFLVDWSNFFESYDIFLALYSVACKLSFLVYNIFIFYFIISCIFYSSFFILSTFFIELGSSNYFFLLLIARSNLTKQWSLLIAYIRDLKLVAPSKHFAQSKNGLIIASIKPLASFKG